MSPTSEGAASQNRRPVNQLALGAAAATAGAASSPALTYLWRNANLRGNHRDIVRLAPFSENVQRFRGGERVRRHRTAIDGKPERGDCKVPRGMERR